MGVTQQTRHGVDFDTERASLGLHEETQTLLVVCRSIWFVLAQSTLSLMAGKGLLHGGTVVHWVLMVVRAWSGPNPL